MMLFKPPDIESAYEVWGANCGPCSLAALCGLTLAQLRPHLGDFERRRYANPTHILEACRRIGVRASTASAWPACGLAFIQWGGPWLKPGVPIGAAYRNTHWIAVRQTAVYDVNAGHWISKADWTDPEDWCAVTIARQVPRCDGTWALRTAVVVDPACLPVRDVIEAAKAGEKAR
jgi:hypothetical protein